MANVQERSPSLLTIHAVKEIGLLNVQHLFQQNELAL
jgi:hypothetical protein